jgi:hypothetical protein
MPSLTSSGLFCLCPAAERENFLTNLCPPDSRPWIKLFSRRLKKKIDKDMGTNVSRFHVPVSLVPGAHFVTIVVVVVAVLNLAFFADVKFLLLLHFVDRGHRDFGRQHLNVN